MGQASIIKVIGVGGGGTNAVTHMYNLGIRGVDFAVCNTDHQSLDISTVPVKVQLGPLLTVGRGAGNNPEVGKQACLESQEELRRFLSGDTKMLFITAGMGGGTGTGAAPIIAKIAKELDILTVGIVTLPFQFEGPRRARLAIEGLESLKDNVDALIVISNNKLREMYGNLAMSTAFTNADNILATAAKGIAEIITVPGYINVDFEDVNFVMKDSGVAIMGSAISSGEDRARKVIELALNSPLLEDNDIRGAKHILLNITTGRSPEITMDEVGEITEYIQQEAGFETDIIWGSCVDESLGENISVTDSKSKNIVNLNDDDTPKVSSVSTSGNTIEFEDINNYKAAPKANPTIPFPYGQSVRKEERAIPEIAATNNKVGFGVSGKSLYESKDLTETENIPAYERRNVRLDQVNHSSELNMSRMRIMMDDEHKMEIREENSFLHDNVD